MTSKTTSRPPYGIELKKELKQEGGSRAFHKSLTVVKYSFTFQKSCSAPKRVQFVCNCSRRQSVRPSSIVIKSSYLSRLLRSLKVYQSQVLQIGKQTPIGREIIVGSAVLRIPKSEIQQRPPVQIRRSVGTSKMPRPSVHDHTIAFLKCRPTVRHGISYIQRSWK